MDDEDEVGPEEECPYCGAEGDEGDLDLDENEVCAECREADRWREELRSDYRHSVL